MKDLINLLLFLVPFGIFWFLYIRFTSQSDRRNLAHLETSRKEGLTEPSSLHPLIDPYKCIGSGACVRACPEGDVLGLIGKKAEIINPTHCIGHGACFAACPTEAITLVFGSEKRGVDIPYVTPSFETNVPGIFISGELGGMGLIRNAIEQGRQAMESIKKLKGSHPDLDVVIVGGGPSGLSASLAAIQYKLRYVTLEQEALGGRVAHYPRGKIVMTQPATLPLVGKVKFKEISKENLLTYWGKIEKQTGVKIQYGERLEDITKTGKGFLVKTNRGSYSPRAVLLAIGRGGTPRKLGFPGEDLPKVVYRLIDPEQYRYKNVLVVGGGDSALEAANSISKEEGSHVVLSYRGEAFSRSKEKNRQNLERAQASGRLKVFLKSTISQVEPDKVLIHFEGKEIELANDHVIVCAGGVLPTEFLKKIGINIQTKFGTA